MKLIWKIIFALVMIVTPVFLLLTSVRALVNPLFLQIEYSLPGFPDDPFGFTREERLKWATLSVEYLMNDSDITFLENLKFNNGQTIYNDRELSHMEDVKNLLQTVIPIWIMLGLYLVMVGLITCRVKRLADFGHALSAGGWTVLGLIAVITIGVALSFSALFTGFHRLFFEGDTWLFYTSDTLIRLFPLRFWRDAFLFVGALTVIEALLLILLGRYLQRSKRVTL